jgi:hypothetical protein
MSAESFKSLWSEMPHLFSFRGRLDVRSCWLTVPLYSYHEPDFQALVESLYFPAFFPMPGNNGCPEHDSFARIDRIQVVHESLVEQSDYVLDETFVLPMFREAAISHWSGVTYGEIYPLTRGDFLGKLREQGVIR